MVQTNDKFNYCIDNYRRYAHVQAADNAVCTSFETENGRAGVEK